MKGRVTFVRHLLTTITVAVVAAVGLMVAWPAPAQSAVACPSGGPRCYEVGDKVTHSLSSTAPGGDFCTVEYKLDWGDGSPVYVETKSTAEPATRLEHAYASPGLYTITRTGKAIPPSHSDCYTPSFWDSTERIKVVAPKPLQVDVVHPKPPKKLCPNEEFHFQVSGKDEDTATWSGGGNPPSGTGRDFNTRFDASGSHTVTAKTATESASATVDVLEESGLKWVSRYPGSTKIADLSQPFRGKVKNFVSALRAAGAKVDISATLRPPERAWLMHYSWQIANRGFDPAAVPEKAGIDICWLHHDSSGNPDKAASVAAAKQMSGPSGYNISSGLKYPPHKDSNHIRGEAIDMNITWKGTLKIATPGGKEVSIATTPRTGAGNAKLWDVAAKHYDVHKLRKGDPPHWSDDGR